MSFFFPFSSSALTFVADELLFPVFFVEDHRVMVEFVGATFLFAFNACVCFGVFHCVAVLTASVANVKILAFLVAPILLKVASTNGTFAFLGAQPASQWAVPVFVICHHIFVKHTVSPISLTILTTVFADVSCGDAFLDAQPASQRAVPFFVIFQDVFVKHTATQVSLTIFTTVFADVFCGDA